MKECARIVLLSQVRITSASVLSCRSPAIFVISSEPAMFILNASVDFSCSKNENSPEVLSSFSAAGDKCERQECFPCTTSIAVQSLLFGIWSAMIREGADCWAKWALCTFDFQNKPGLHCFWADQTRLSKQWTLIFLVCILLECERTKTKILHFYIGTKCIPFKKGPKLCASDFGDVQKNMIYLVWRCPTFEGPIFMLEQERWQRWLKKPEQILQILLLFGIVLAGSQLMTIVAPFSHEGASKVKKWGQMTISKTLLLCVMCYACGSAAAYAHDGPICIINKSLHREDINQLVVLK